MSGNFLSCHKGVKDPFEAQEGRRNFSQDATVENGLISRGEETFLVFLELQQQTWVSSRVKTGTSGTRSWTSGNSSLHASCEGPLSNPLQSLLGLRYLSGVEAENSGILSSNDMDVGIPLKFPQSSHASSCVLTFKSALLSSWNSSFRLPFVLT